MIIPAPTIRTAFHDFVASHRPTLFITLAFNRDSTIPSLRGKIASFHARLDHDLHGRDWSRHPSSQRTEAFWFFEHLASNAHCHGLLAIPHAHRFDGLYAIPGRVIDPRETIIPIGRSLAPSADCDVQHIYDLPGAIEYAMKDWRDPTGCVLASEFHSPRSRSLH